MAQRKQKTKATNTKSSIKTRKPMSRRDLLSNLKYAALGAAVVGGGAWFIVDDVMATLGEQDLSKIGNGVPTIVQIHDPQCSLCLALQRETRQALENFDAGELQYLVANIKSEEGRALANKHGVQHVTLLLLDGKGRQRQILAGSNHSAHLTEAFRTHLEKYGKK